MKPENLINIFIAMGMVLRKGRFIVNINTNKGVETQNKTFKRTCLKKHHGSWNANILIGEYFPE